MTREQIQWGHRSAQAALVMSAWVRGKEGVEEPGGGGKGG